MQRTEPNSKRELEIVDAFKGVNQIVDEVKLPKDFAPESRGGYFNEASVFERLKGKLLNSSNSTGGHVLTIAHLLFRDSSAVLIHQGTAYVVEEDVSALTAGDNTPVSPLEPIIT